MLTTQEVRIPATTIYRWKSVCGPLSVTKLSDIQSSLNNISFPLQEYKFKIIIDLKVLVNRI